MERSDDAGGRRTGPLAPSIPFELLAEASSDVLVLGAPDRPETVWVSPSMTAVLGWMPADWLGRSPMDFIHPDDAARLARDIANRRSDDEILDEYRIRHADGGYRWVQAVTSYLRDSDDEVIGRLASLRDVTSSVNDRHRLERSERQFRLAMEGSPEGMAVVALDRTVLSANPALCRMLGRHERDVRGRKLTELLHPDDRDADAEMRRALLHGPDDSATAERRLIGPDGDVVVVHAVGLLRDSDGRALFFVSQFKDMTELKAAEAGLRAAATHDPLTGLANRAGLMEEIGRAVAAARRYGGRFVAVLMLDLDHFKYVNDSLGHLVGDELLRLAADRLRSMVRTEDLVARQGGDEFVVVMRDADGPTEVVRAAERLCAAFRAPFVIGDLELSTTLSIGITMCGDGDCGEADDLLREADTALYVAKDGGRDRAALFNDVLRASVDERLRVENELRAAVARDEFVLWYQPEIDLRNGSMRAVEALVRWRHPSGELYTADRFIDVAEDTGLILEIGGFVMREAFRQAAAWDAAMPARRLVVRFNLSALQLSEAGLLVSIDDALDESGVDPSLLCAEITETALLRDVQAVRRNLLGLRTRGIRVAVDDFGTGYASLTYLRDFPVDVLKLDRSFVSRVAVDDHDYRLVSGVIALAERLQVPVTAEGVEDEVQAGILRELGCQGAQGWLYSRAVPPEDIVEQLEIERRIS